MTAIIFYNYYSYEPTSGILSLLDIFRRCPQWSKDEGICARNVNNEVQFYEGNNFGMFDHSPLLLLSNQNFSAVEPNYCNWNITWLIYSSQNFVIFVTLETLYFLFQINKCALMLFTKDLVFLIMFSKIF